MKLPRLAFSKKGHALKHSSRNLPIMVFHLLPISTRSSILQDTAGRSQSRAIADEQSKKNTRRIHSTLSYGNDGRPAIEGAFRDQPRCLRLAVEPSFDRFPQAAGAFAADLPGYA